MGVHLMLLWWMLLSERKHAAAQEAPAAEARYARLWKSLVKEWEPSSLNHGEFVPCRWAVESLGGECSTHQEMAMMEEENFQTWLAHNRNQPLSEEVTRLQSLVTRLEAKHQTDYRRLRRAESEWWSLLRKGFLVCLGLVAVLLWYLNSYLETKGSLEVVCGFIAREAQNKIRDDARGSPGDLEDAHRVCSEEGALP
jgi:hypothetical protein